MVVKVTTMRLKADLQCEKCYRKVKKVLCEFPQIEDQVYDKKQNIVTIKVVCCSPEKIRDKLCCKGCGCIKSIQIVEPPKPTPPPPPKRTPEPTPSPSPSPKPTPSPSPSPSPKPKCKTPPPPSTKLKCKPTCCDECNKGRSGGPCFEGCSGVPRRPIGMCCDECNEGRPGGPCFEACGGPPPRPIGTCCDECSAGRPGGPCFKGCGGPPPYYEGYFYARPVYGSYRGGRPCYVSRCDQYFSEDNPSGCTIM